MRLLQAFFIILFISGCSEEFESCELLLDDRIECQNSNWFYYGESVASCGIQEENGYLKEQHLFDIERGCITKKLYSVYNI